MVKDKILLTAVVSVGTLHSGDRHQARFHGQHLGLCRLILVGHGDDFTGSIFLHGHHGTSLNIRGIARRDDLRRTALIGGCDLHSREIQQLTRGIDPLVRLLRHSDGLHRIRYRLDRDRRAEVTRRNSDGVLARLPVSNTDGKVRHILGLASLVDALDRQPSLQLFQRGGVIELCIRLHAGRQRGRLNDGEELLVAVFQTGGVPVCIRSQNGESRLQLRFVHVHQGFELHASKCAMICQNGFLAFRNSNALDRCP